MARNIYSKQRINKLVHEKSGYLKTKYKLNQFCRTIKRFILYFKDEKAITEESIVDFCYNLLIKDFEKGIKIQNY